MKLVHQITSGIAGWLTYEQMRRGTDMRSRVAVRSNAPSWRCPTAHVPRLLIASPGQALKPYREQERPPRREHFTLADVAQRSGGGRAPWHVRNPVARRDRCARRAVLQGHHDGGGFAMMDLFVMRISIGLGVRFLVATIPEPRFVIGLAHRIGLAGSTGGHRTSFMVWLGLTVSRKAARATPMMRTPHRGWRIERGCSAAGRSRWRVEAALGTERRKGRCNERFDCCERYAHQ